MAHQLQVTGSASFAFLGGSGNVITGADNLGDLFKITIGSNLTLSGGVLSATGGGTGSVTSVGLTTSAGALTITNSPITTSGNIGINFAGTTAQYVRGDGSLATFPTITGYVPYTGATQNLDLGTYGLLTDFVGFNTAPTSIPTTQGTLSWNVDKESLDLIMNGTTGSLMQDTFYNVKNQTGATIPKGTVVRANGTVGASGRILIAPFLADGTYSSKYCMGVTAEAIADGADGKVLAFGALRKIDTSAYTNGTILYASPTTAGAFTTTEPSNPNNIVTLAIVVYSDNTNGEIFVRPTFVPSQAELILSLGYTPANDANVVKLTGNQTVGGVKTFSAESIFSNGITLTGGDLVLKSGTYTNTINTDTLIANRSILFPDNSGTVALTSDIVYPVTSVFGRTGDVVAVDGDYNTDLVTEGSTNLYYTNTRARLAFSANPGSALTYNNATGRYTLVAAESGIDGYLTGADWDYFDSKQASLGTGTTSQFLRGDLVWAAPAPISLDEISDVDYVGTPSTGQLLRYRIDHWENWTPTYVAAGFFSATAPLSYDSGTGVFSISQATTSTNGYLSSTDWNTFNSKQSALTFSSPLVNTSGTITINQATSSTSGYLSSTDWNTFNNKQSALTNPVTGTGTTNKVPKFNGTSTITDSSITDAASTPLVINKDSSTITNSIVSIYPTTGTNASILNLDNSGAGSFYIGRQNSAGASALLAVSAYDSVVGHTGSQNLHLVTGATSRIAVFGSGNIGVATTTDAGYKLDVSGTGRFSGTLNANGILNTANDVNINKADSDSIYTGSQIWLSGTYTGIRSGTDHSFNIDTYNAAGGTRLNAFKILQSGAASFVSSISFPNGSITSSGELSLNSSSPGIYTYGRYAGTNGGRIFFNNGTGANLFLGEVATHIYAFTGNSATNTPILSIDALNYRVGINTNTPSKKLEIKYVTGGDLTAIIRLNSSAGGQNTSIEYAQADSVKWEVGTGMATSSDYEIRDRVNSANRLTINASTGNVLIGTTTDSGYKLDVAGIGRMSSGVYAGDSKFYNSVQLTDSLGGTCQGFLWTDASNTLKFGVGTVSGANVKMTINSSGKVGINTTGFNSVNQLNVYGAQERVAQFMAGGDSTIIVGGTAADGASSGEQYITYQNATTNTNAWMVGMDDGEDWRFAYGAQGEITDANTLIRLTQGGNLLIGTLTDAGYKLYISGSVGSTGGFFEASDKRLKKELIDNPTSVNIENVKPKLYIKDGKEELGYYAQDLQSILPSSVTEGKDGFLSLSYTQVHTAKIASLEREVAELKELIKTLIK